MSATVTGVKRQPILEVRMADARKAGEAAQRAGKPRTACPGKLDDPDVVARLLAKMWCRGWDNANPMPLPRPTG